MLQIFRGMGHMVRALVCLGFASFWGYLAWHFHGMGEGGPGEPTVIGIGAFAVLAGVGALMNLLRVLSAGRISPSERAALQSWDADQPSDFDADAIMARHLAKRQMAQGAAPAPEAAAPPVPTRAAPAFGRKVV